jgi:hypothetical protein
MLEKLRTDKKWPRLAHNLRRKGEAMKKCLRNLKESRRTSKCSRDENEY